MKVREFMESLKKTKFATEAGKRGDYLESFSRVDFEIERNYEVIREKLTLPELIKDDKLMELDFLFVAECYIIAPYNTSYNSWHLKIVVK